MRNRRNKVLLAAVGVLVTFAITFPVSAQIRPLGTQYYENQYISNPAFAGMDKGLNVNLSYRNQWRSVPGSPVTMAFSGDYRFERVGVGFIAYNDKAGLIGSTRVMGSYAYHLPLKGENKSLHFGLSVGVTKENLDNQNIVGAPDDVLALRFNERKPFLDGDFGIAYTNDRFTIQGALPNLSKFFHKDALNRIDGSTYFAAMSYKIATALNVVIEPKISYRGAKDIESIWDVGTNLRLENNIVSFMGMYRSDKSSVFGFGVNYQKYYFIQFFYTSQLAGGRMGTGGDFEVNFKINLQGAKVKKLQ